MTDSLPWDSDKPLSISQLLKQSMRSVDTIVKDGSLLDMMSTHLNGLLRQQTRDASEGDKSILVFNNMFKQAEKAMTSDSDKQVVNVLRRQVASFIGITLGVKSFLELQEDQRQDSDEEGEEDDRYKLSLSAARHNESESAWKESKAYYDQNNVDIFSPERTESEKLRNQEEQLAREYHQRDEDEEEDEDDEYEEVEEVVEEVQVKSREIGSREVGSREIGGGSEFKVVRRRQKKKKTQIETNFNYGGYHDNNRDDGNSCGNNYQKPYYKQPPRHRVRITEFHPKYLERLNTEVFCMPLFFPSEDSYGYFHSALASAKETLHVCVYSITDNDTADVLIDAKKRGVDVKVITDNDQMDPGKGADALRLRDKFDIPIKNDDSEQFMHNKFAVMDNKIVITGSFNWSLGARYKNRENIIITNIPSVVREYSKQFDELWRYY